MSTPCDQIGIGRVQTRTRHLRERLGGVVLPEKIARGHGNLVQPVSKQSNGPLSLPLLLSACSRAFPEEPPRGSRHEGSTSEIGASYEGQGFFDVESCKQRDDGQRTTFNESSHDTAQLEGAAGEGLHHGVESVKESSKMPVRALVLMLSEEEDPIQRRNIIIMLQDFAPKDDALVIHALCERLLEKQEPIPTRRMILVSLRKLAERGNREVVDALLRCVETDQCFEIRQAAVALLAYVAPFHDERVMSLALEELRKKDLRGEPLFKPYGDPLALTKESIQVIAEIAPRGSLEAWQLLLRRVVDDSVVAVRIAAVEALASIADPDMLADGGARATVQALAIAMLDHDIVASADTLRLRNASVSTFKALMHPAGREGPAAGGKYWL